MNAPAPTPQTRPASALAQRYQTLRAQTLALAAPLSEADCQAQSMPDASPAKWHLAHVTWFFETFILERFETHFEPFNPAFRVLFNSYYQAVGQQHPRPQRGLITRPDLAEVKAYRANVDARLLALLSGPVEGEIAELLTLGLHHEQQHQELLLTDIKHLLAQNPLNPVYSSHWPLCQVTSVPLEWVAIEGGAVDIGHTGDGFVFDNETPQHRAWLAPYALGNRLVTHGEWAAFVNSGGYRDPRWWMSAGWDWVQSQGIEAPLYWAANGEGGWTTFTLHGRVPVDPHTPICHINWFEADAYARWRAAVDGLPIRLPTEAEWEHAARGLGDHWHAHGNFQNSQALHPLPLNRAQPGQLQQMGGDVWEWTASSYLPYPGYRAWAGAVGEYNGKFMINQMVLRGGSCATPRDHIRTSYRNFFPHRRALAVQRLAPRQRSLNALHTPYALMPRHRASPTSLLFLIALAHQPLAHAQVPREAWLDQMSTVTPDPLSREDAGNQGSALGACADTAYEAMFAAQRIANKRADDPNNWR